MEEAFAKFDYVVNCTGLGSRELFGDSTLFAGRGQTVVVRGNAHETVVSTHCDSVTYIIPRGGDIVLGGTFQRGNESLLVSEEDTKGILERCGGLYKILEPSKVDVIREKVGLRPCRPEVRLEPELFHLGRKLVIHNYGHGESLPLSLSSLPLLFHFDSEILHPLSFFALHLSSGGGGWTTCFGCAKEVVEILDKHLDQGKSRL